MRLKNRYYLIRHGESEANRTSIIVSSPDSALESYGLTGNGRKQIRDAVKINKDNFHEDKIVIISSDFLRARESSEIIAREIECETVIFTPLLRERFFGKYEGMPSSSYYSVWKSDLDNVNNKEKGVESSLEVRERVLTVINGCEVEFENRTILLVSHGDPLQILLATFLGLPSNMHRDIPPLKNADLRELTLKPGVRIKEML